MFSLKSLLLGGFAVLAAGLPAAAETVTITIKNVRSSSGMVLAQMCDNPEGYPRANCRYQTAVPAELGSVTLVFEGVAPGTYAVAAFHDEDGDFVPTIPGEGFAYSNDAPPPRPMSDASFAVKGDTRQTMHMIYERKDQPK